MGYVDTQVLGRSAASYSVNSSTKQTMIDALAANKAVTIGTLSNAGSGLYGSHAYAVLSYNASNDTFTLYNPWGYAHPGALTWSQLMANCSAWVSADASSITSFASAGLRSNLETAMMNTLSPSDHAHADGGRLDAATKSRK